MNDIDSAFIPQMGPQEIAEKGEKIYKEELKKKLEPEHNGDFVAIEVGSGKYFLGKTAEEATNQAKLKFPQGIFHLIKVGFPSAFSLGSCFAC